LTLFKIFTESKKKTVYGSKAAMSNPNGLPSQKIMSLS